MKSWRARVVCEGEGYRPRQFEYSPHVAGRLVFGTTRGEVVVCELPSASSSSSSKSTTDSDKNDNGNGGGGREGMDEEVQQEQEDAKEEGTEILRRFEGKTPGTRLAKDRNDSILGYVHT
jgi:hypothetical protein